MAGSDSFTCIHKQLSKMQTPHSMDAKRNEMFVEPSKEQYNEGSRNYNKVRCGEKPENKQGRSTMDKGKWLEKGREWWEERGRKGEEKQKVERRKDKIMSGGRMKIGATMIMGVELLEGSKQKDHKERVSEVGKSMGDLKLLLEVECKEVGGSRGGPDVYSRQEMRREANMLLQSGEERSKIAKWGVNRVREIWYALEDPAIDGGEIDGRVNAADEIIDAIAAGKRSRDRYSSHASIMVCSPMDVNRVMNWMASLQKWDALRQVEESDVLLGASVILCGECIDKESEIHAAERVVAVQRTLADLRKRFRSLSSCRSYVVHRGPLVVVVLIAPKKELFEIQNCITPFLLMQNPGSNAYAQAPCCHLIARELFYAADNSRRLFWAIANMTILVECALSISRTHASIATMVSSALTAPAVEWRQIIGTLSRNRYAILALFSVSSSSHEERLWAVLPLLLPITKSACLPFSFSLIARFSSKKDRNTGMPLFSATSAVLLVGSIPRQGISASTKFLRRYPSFEAISKTKLAASSFKDFVIS